jgi:hypothetical protein
MSVFVFCGPESQNGKASRQVILKAGDGKEYRDKIDVGSGFQRQALLERAAAQFDVPVEEMLTLDSELVREADREDKRAAAEGDKSEAIDYGAISAAQLDRQEYHLEYLIPSILAAGQHCLLGGPHKSLKSLVAADLAVSLALGGHFLGYFPVARAARVALLSGECGWPVVQENLRRVARAAGRELADVGGLLVGTKLPMFGSAAHAEATRRFLRDNEVEVGIFDCAYLCVPTGGGGNVAANVFLMGELLRSLADVFVEANATMILLHHTTKGAGGDGEPIDLENLSFAGFREFAAQWLLLSRRAKYEPGTGHHELWISSGGRAGHSGLWSLTVDEGEYEPGAMRQWEVSVAHADDARQDVQDRAEEKRREKAAALLESDRKAVVAMVAKQKNPETKNALRNRASFGHGRFDRAFASLVEEGELVPVEVKKGNERPYEGWELRKAEG